MKTRETLHLEGPFSEAEKNRTDSFVSRLIYGGASEAPSGGRGLLVHIEQVASRPFPCFQSLVGADFVWRRTAADIRKDGADFCAIRFVRSGITRVTQLGRTADYRAGDIALTRSNLPAHAEIMPDVDGKPADTALLLVPSALLQEHLEIDQIVNCQLPQDTPHYRVLVDLIEMLMHRSADLDEDAGDMLAGLFLTELGKLAQIASKGEDIHQSIPDTRLADIRAKIRAHFSNPYLSLEMIAQKCGISTRYVTHIMSKYETSFYEELKLERLRTARRMLRDEKNRKMPIKQVAFFTGFKSTSHFSTVYKKSFGMSPHEERGH